MVFRNFFITFVRHSFHTSHPCTSPSRERRHRPATRHHTPLMAHALPHALHLAKGLCSRATHTLRILVPHTTHALHTTPPRKGLCSRATHTLRILVPHTTHALHTTPRKGLCHAHAHAQKCRNAFPCSPLLSKKKERASTTKILHITILHVTFTRIGVKTTQKSEAIFSFID